MIGPGGFYGFSVYVGSIALKIGGTVIKALAAPFIFLFRMLKKVFSSGGSFSHKGSVVGDGAEKDSRSGKKDTFPFAVLILAAIPVAVISAVIFAIGTHNSPDKVIRLKVGGNTVGYVLSTEVYDEALAAAEERLKVCGGASGYKLPDIELEYETADSGRCLSADVLTDVLLRNADGDFTDACGVYVNGKFLLAVKSEAQAHSVLDSVLEEKRADCDPSDVYAFYDTVEYVHGVYPSDKGCLKSSDEFKSIAEGFSVMVTKTEIGEESVPFPFVEIPSRTLNVSTARTILQGVNGTDRVTRLVTYVDGKAIDSKEIDRVTVEEPIAMHRLVGTKIYSLVVPIMTQSDQLIWPVDGAYNINSDYSYRWGSFHYGLDIGVGSAPGTSLGKNVLAAADGVVVLATTHSSYGYYIILDHGNGMQTVYGHLYQDSFMVRPGEYVYAGQPIAKVGQTGYATGPHLHFEVRVNGTKVDPKIYFQQYKGIGY